MMQPRSRTWCLKLSCASERGTVARVTALLERHHAYIEGFSCYDDEVGGRFYLRCAFRLESADGAAMHRLQSEFDELKISFPQASGGLFDLARKTRVLVMVSKADHCLRDLLAQWRREELPMVLVAVASNHMDLAPLVQAEGLPFHHAPITAQTKPQQEAVLLDLIREHRAELVILARYMQVLSAPMCEQLAGRAINIHHSFLPGFKGANPYAQAYDRGVKIIGATAHFVTTDLDEGPIIEQAVERVDHTKSPAELLRIGRSVECLALSRAVRDVLEHRVFINGHRTVVLR